ncbi:MAG: sulfotransferase [Gammaproteobacteria bacterium]
MPSPNGAADLALMRASVLLDSDPAAAVREASKILADAPGHAEASLLFAAACRRLGDAATAAHVLEALAEAQPRSPIMQLELGRTYAAKGRISEALDAFQRTVDLDASLADAWRELAALRFLAGETFLGDMAYLKFTRLAQDPPELADAYVARAADRLEAAETIVRQHLVRMPRDAKALRMLGDLAARRGDNAEAERRLIECLEIAPGDAAARHDLAWLLIRSERVAEALPLLDRLLACEPGNPRHLGLKAQGLRLVGRTAEAIALMEGVVADFPDDAAAWLILGNSLRELGEQSRAIDAFRRALAARPGFGEAYWALANLMTFRFAGSDVKNMQQQRERHTDSGSSRIHLEFALGKALEDAGQFAASFEHYACGARLQRATMAYNAEDTTEYVRRSAATLTADMFSDRASWGSERRDPIFIVGLPRSGSTLIEQILASHSQIEGTRELPDLPAIVMKLHACADSASAGYPELIASLSRAEIGGIAARYLAGTESRRPLGLPHFVDKMLGNFNHVGLIHLMFPRAAIIDARRHPLAGCFSCYKQLFAQSMNFSYDLGEMGRYYRDYVELMQHIDTVLPGRMHRVHYELLVAEPEREIRRLLEYCGLPFEDQCLRFYDSRRVVHTISSEQVRRPIYSDAVEQWRHYEPWLGSLKDAVGELVEHYPRPKKKPPSELGG